MSKTLTYSGFAISALLVIFAFVTAKNYTQLAIAVILYPLLAYFAMKIFPRREISSPAVTVQVPKPAVIQKAQPLNEEHVVADIDKRTFLKLVGAAGLSFFVFSILGRRVESLLFGDSVSQGTSSLGVAPKVQTGQVSQPMEGYKITEIDDGLVSYYGFTNKDGAWLIMKEDTESSSFRYAKGDVNFSNSWVNRANLKYDYYYKLF